MATQIAIPEAAEFQRADDLSPKALLAYALKNGSAIDVIERFAALQERADAKAAESAFNRDLQAAQQEIPVIVPDKAVKKNNGDIMFRYSSYEGLDKVIRPIYLKYGFSLSFSGGESTHASKVRVLCRLAHREGHAGNYMCDLAIDPGKAGLSQTDAELGAQSKAKRRILRNIFNIVDDGEDEILTNGWLLERIEWIGNCRNMEELGKVFNAAFKEAKKAKMGAALLPLVEARDKRAGELQ